MPRYIDVEKIDFRIPYYPDEDGGDALVSLKAVKRCIAMTPTADVVEVVRCKDCKYSGVKDFVYGYCKGKVVGEVKPYDFCCYGERKE